MTEQKKLKDGLIYRVATATYGLFLGLMLLAPLFPSANDWDQRKRPAAESAPTLDLKVWVRAAHDGPAHDGSDRDGATHEGQCADGRIHLR